ncbi:MAG: hypothetical protein IT201_12890 [Thermoleophilia bacterium]|nr:hypothetical protein [Thermoleophilia bacterium]
MAAVILPARRRSGSETAAGPGREHGNLNESLDAGGALRPLAALAAATSTGHVASGRAAER